RPRCQDANSGARRGLASHPSAVDPCPKGTGAGSGSPRSTMQTHVNQVILGLEVMKAGRFKQWAMGVAAMATPVLAFAQSADPERWQLNMGRGVTHLSNNAYDAHMFALWVCVAIGVLVFGAMAVAMFKFRKSKGAVAAQFSHNTTAEVIWTIVPIIILIVMVWPATAKLISQYDTRDSAMTVKVTGYQWLW